MKNYLLKVKNVLKIPKHTFQDNLTQYQGSNGHSATSDVGKSFWPQKHKIKILHFLPKKGMIWHLAGIAVPRGPIIPGH